MYDEFFNFEKGRVLDFKKTEIWFNLSFFKRYAHFRCFDNVPIPSRGEHIRVSFLNDKLGFE